MMVEKNIIEFRCANHTSFTHLSIILARVPAAYRARKSAHANRDCIFTRSYDRRVLEDRCGNHSDRTKVVTCNHRLTKAAGQALGHSTQDD